MHRRIARLAFVALGFGLGTGLVASVAHAEGYPVSGAYGPLLANREKGGDFFVSQAGRLVPVRQEGERLVFTLAPGPFEIGARTPELRLCLAEKPRAEVFMLGDMAMSCLAPGLTVARDVDGSALAVGASDAAAEWSNSYFDADSPSDPPPAGHASLFPVDELEFADAARKLAGYRGTLYGYLRVPDEDKAWRATVVPIALEFRGQPVGPR
ncbi:MAG: hypothetical protein EON59_07655, partial [Alphaproteobacteria bacterium]